MTVKALPVQVRPREKLLARGAGALSDAELIALLLRTGTAGKGVLQMAEELLHPGTLAWSGKAPFPGGSGGDGGGARARASGGGIAGLLMATPQSLAAVKGLGPAKQAQILAVLELARRALGQQLQQGGTVTDGVAMKQYLQLHIAARPYEVFAVCFLDHHNRLLALEEMFRGTLTHTAVHPREVAQRALHWGATAVVLAHNHPSGAVQPSPADTALTRTLRDALALLEVRVIDHFIVAPGLALSMAEQGLL